MFSIKNYFTSVIDFKHYLDDRRVQITGLHIVRQTVIGIVYNYLVIILKKSKYLNQKSM